MVRAMLTSHGTFRSPEKQAVSKRVQVAFGKRLQSQRKGQRNQDQLAEALDVSRTTISNI